jgi:hypothetical protein
MPTIMLSESAFAALKSLAEPSRDTPESMAARLIEQEVVRRRGDAGAATYIRTPRLAYPEQAADFRKEVHEAGVDAKV